MAQQATLSETLLTIRAQQAAHWQKANGKLDGFASFWAEKQDTFLLAAKTRVDKQNTATTDKAKSAEIMSQKRSEMSRAQKLAFIEEHGVEKFQELAS